MKEKLAEKASKILSEKRQLESDLAMLSNKDDWFLCISLRSYSDYKDNFNSIQRDSNLKDMIEDIIVKETKKKIEKLTKELEELN